MCVLLDLSTRVPDQTLTHRTTGIHGSDMGELHLQLSCLESSMLYVCILRDEPLPNQAIRCLARLVTMLVFPRFGEILQWLGPSP